jgi:hypothetical protein
MPIGVSKEEAKESEEQAKVDICHAMADRKINVRVRAAGTDRVYSGGNVEVPRHLSPDDLDWTRSRPKAPWQIGPRLGEHYMWIGGWEHQSIDLIELSTADVTEVLCGGEDSAATMAPATKEAREQPTSVSRRGRRPRADWEAVEIALRDHIKTHDFPNDDNVDLDWRCQADVERWVAQLLDVRNEPIGESRLREKVREILVRIKKAGN